MGGGAAVAGGGNGAEPKLGVRSVLSVAANSGACPVTDSSPSPVQRSSPTKGFCCKLVLAQILERLEVGCHSPTSIQCTKLRISYLDT